MDRSIPREFLCRLISWYSMCAAYVRWYNMLPDMVILVYGVRIFDQALRSLFWGALLGIDENHGIHGKREFWRLP